MPPPVGCWSQLCGSIAPDVGARWRCVAEETEYVSLEQSEDATRGLLSTTAGYRDYYCDYDVVSLLCYGCCQIATISITIIKEVMVSAVIMSPI